VPIINLLNLLIIILYDKIFGYYELQDVLKFKIFLSVNQTIISLFYLKNTFINYKNTFINYYSFI
jgi:hypothetical protein